MAANENDSNDIARSRAQFAKNAAIGHYRIIEKIGSGGMGEVYLAEDTELNRTVALKFLPPHLCQDAECRARFKREAQAAAKLSHPNIITIHEVGEHEGHPYFAMEHVDGLPLDEYAKLKKASLDQIINLAIQICEGLNKAHQAGIVHRDIKPSNILVDKEGRARILDFGLATIKGEKKLTMTGSTLGTINYMSPEQTRGEESDQRSDIFSLGTVLYEMIAGQLPFRGDYEPAILYAIATQEPEPLARFKAGVPEELQRIVSKMLAKDSSHRYQTVTDLLADLKRLSTENLPATSKNRGRSRRNRHAVTLAAAVLLIIAGYWAVTTFVLPAGKKQEAGRKMLAVLPFENLGSPDDEYFADGITDEISARLGSLSGLGVISRTSAMQYKRSSKSLPAIARELGVEYILEGTIRWERAGGSSRVRIIPRLIREPEDVQLWADNIDRVLQDIFAIQSDIAGRVVASLDIALLGSEKRSLASVPTRNLEAHDLYLQGRFYWNKRTPQDLTTAVKLFEQAIAKDSTYALAYAGLADCYVLLPDYAGVGREYYAKAEATALKALSLDASLAEAHAALGQEKYDNWDWTGAEKEYRRAIELDPNYATAHHWYANYLASMKRFEEAMREIKRAHELDPVSRAIMAAWAEIAMYSRDYDQAIAQCRAALEMDPTFGNAHWVLGSVYDLQGRHDEAVSEWLETVTPSWNYDSRDQQELRKAYAAGGWRAFYHEVVRMADAKWTQDVSWTDDGMWACMALGDYDGAFTWLDRMYEQHDSELISINVDPLYDPIRTDKRFVALLKKVGLEK